MSARSRSPIGVRHIDAVEQRSSLDWLQQGSLALADNVFRSAYRRGGIDRHDLADHQPVEQMPDRGEPLLHGRSGRRLCLHLQPGGHMQRLHIA